MTLKDLKDSLQAPYKLENWQNILREVLGKPIFLTKDAYQPLFEETDFVEKAFQFGSYDLPKNRKIAIVDIKLKDEKTPRIADTKVKLRELAAKLVGLTNSEGHQFVGVLAFFHSTQQKNYRLSFIARAAEYNAEIDDFVNVETANKRFTYILGEGESCTTAAKQLVGLIDKAKIQAIELNDIKEAFNVDKLNKEFFKGYKEHYEKFWKYIKSIDEYRNVLLDIEQTVLDKQEKPIRDFAKKLLGRIVFLYFLQKKGWMGVPLTQPDWKDGDNNFTKNLFQNSTSKAQFYSTALVELFFNTLNKSRENDVFELTKTKIPYLNGGLFDNDLPETNHFDFPESYFQDLFEFFDQYNFTIDENSPDDANVGIDPEMLGHIFENLLEENKDKGAFYTPKAIVQYMCQESLIQYLETHLLSAENRSLSEVEGNISALIRHNDRGDAKGFITKNARKIEELLDNVKICDPAIGSGAFPMGMLHEIFKAKMTLDLTLDPAETKRHIIQNSIYGVDLERGAVDIARLRFWLALVVDEDAPSPLPNLDYKIMQGNSLLESFEGIPLDNILKKQNVVYMIDNGQMDMFGQIKNPQISMEFLDKQTTNLSELIERYFDAESTEQKPTLRKQINSQVHEHLHYNVELVQNKALILKADLDEKLALVVLNDNDSKQKRTEKEKKIVFLEKQIVKIQQDLDRLENAFVKLDEIEHKNERPFFLWHLYFKDVFDEGGFDIVIGNPPYVRQEALGEIKIILEKAYPKTYKGTADLLVYFVELGYNLLRTNGVFAYIVSNKWIRAGYGEGMRKLLIQNRLLELIDFGDLPVFEGATAYPCVVRFQKASPMEAFSVTIATELPQKVGLLNHVQQNNFSLKLTELDPEGWQLNNPIQQNLLTKLNKNAKILENYIDGEAYRGVLTGASNEFSLDEKQCTALILEDAKSEEIIKPVLLGRDIARYQIAETQRYMIFTRRGIDIEQYPAILKHLLPFKDRLTPKPKDWKGEWKGRKEGSYKWYELQDAVDYYQLFDKPKIMYQAFQVKPCFIYDEEGLYCNNSMWFLPTADKYLLGVLNSKVGWYAITQYCTKIQNGYQLIYDYLRKVPIAVPTETQKTQIETLVNQILINKKAGKDTLVLEGEIDRLVYALYELTEAEIAVVEGR